MQPFLLSLRARRWHGWLTRPLWLLTAALAPNSTTPDAAGHGQGWFTSHSPFSGGVNAALADGSVRFFRDSISVTTWRALATRAGGEVINASDY